MSTHKHHFLISVDIDKSLVVLHEHTSDTAGSMRFPYYCMSLCQYCPLCACVGGGGTR